MNHRRCMSRACAGRGGNFIDTAELYPAPIGPQNVGRSEEIVGRWLKARGCRAEFIIATKVGTTPSHTASVH